MVTLDAFLSTDHSADSITLSTFFLHAKLTDLNFPPGSLFGQQKSFSLYKEKPCILMGLFYVIKILSCQC